MMLTTEVIQLENSLRLLHGRKVEKASIRFAENLTLDFLGSHDEKEPNDEKDWLWIRQSYWRLSRGGEILAVSGAIFLLDQNIEALKNTVRVLEGLKLLDHKIDTFLGDLRLDFGDGYILDSYVIANDPEAWLARIKPLSFGVYPNSKIEINYTHDAQRLLFDQYPLK